MNLCVFLGRWYEDSDGMCPVSVERLLFEAQLSTKDSERQKKAMRSASALLSQLYDPKVCSATIATQLHHAVYEALGDKDPYKVLNNKATVLPHPWCLRWSPLVRIHRSFADEYGLFDYWRISWILGLMVPVRTRKCCRRS